MFYFVQFLKLKNTTKKKIHNKRTRHRHQRPHPEAWHESQNHHIYLVQNLENQLKILQNAMYEVQADILVTTKKLPLGLILMTLFILHWNLSIKKKYLCLKFSISNYPNYESHMPPPARFLDTTGDKKTTGSSPRIRANPKLHREAFQINV